MFWPINAFASDNAWNYSFGISVKQLALDVYEKGQTDPEGILTDDFRVFPELGFESNITYFSNSSWGYKFAINLGWFEMTTQEVALEDVNLVPRQTVIIYMQCPLAFIIFSKRKKTAPYWLALGSA